MSPREKDFQLRGTLIHLALAYYYGSKLNPRPKWFEERDLFSALDERGRGCPDGIQCAKENLELYMQAYANDVWKPLHVEEEFAATLGELDPGGPFPEIDDEIVTCRPDLVVEAGGSAWVVDYKTAGKVWRRDGKLDRWKDDGAFALDWQVLVNLTIVRKRLARPVKGFVVERLKREAPYDFDRHVLRIPGWAYEQTPRELRLAVKSEIDIVDALNKGILPSPSFHLCYGRYGPCDYRPICQSDSREQALRVMNTEYVRET